jgi:hypothetical protein
MKLDINDFSEGVKDILALYKQGNNIFEMKSGDLFPHNTSQSTWQFAKDNGNIHFSDGTHTYSFKGDLSEYDTELEKMPEAPLPNVFSNAKIKGRAQVHRSDPGSIYFTLQEGRNNPTYTLKHQGDSKWKAIPKPRKVKAQLKETVTPLNVNLEKVKEGMLKELEEFIKEGDGPSFFDNANHVIGRGVQGLANGITKLPLLPGRIGGEVPVQQSDNGPISTEGAGTIAGNALLASGIGAGSGLLYHLAKRNLLNTTQENAEEDAEGGKLGKRVMLPALGMAGLNIAGRQMLPNAINDPKLNIFP